jgi:cell division septation protein DedD
MFRINLLKRMPQREENADSPADAGKSARGGNTSTYIAIAIAAFAILATWSYFKGSGREDRPVTVVRLQKETPRPAAESPTREASAERRVTAPQVTVKEKGPPSTPAKKPEISSRETTPRRGASQEASALSSEAKEKPSELISAPVKKGTPLELPDKQMPVVLHVASYKSQGSARKEVLRLKAKGYPAFMATFNLGDKGIWQRVFAGRYGSSAEAAAAGATLKKKGLVDYASPMKLPYSLQVGVFSSLRKAEKGAERLNLLGYAANVLKVKSNDGGLYYRLLVGAYKDRDSAAETAARLKDDGYRAIPATP